MMLYITLSYDIEACEIDDFRLPIERSLREREQEGGKT